MITLLRSWDGIGNAVNGLLKAGMPIHGMPQKNWDIWQIYQLLKDKKKSTRIFDFGCRGSYVLKLCRKMGLHQTYGMDLYKLVNKHEILIYCREILTHFIFKFIDGKNPYYLIRGDGLHNHFPNAFFEVIVSLSVIEHGVDLDMFFKESYRLLCNEGMLFVSTDYSHKKVNSGRDDWTIFSKEEILELIEIATKHGFKLKENGSVEENDNILTNSTGTKQYTFLSIVFEKVKK
jgi:SAM-dependent methyltransferase